MVYTDRVHLVADNVDELHAFALELSLKRHFFHGVRKSHPHYDLTNAQIVTLAINHGAEIVTSKELIKIYPDVT